MMRTSAIVRIRIITAMVLCVALILIVRLYHVQVVHGKDYRDSAEKQYVHTAQDFFNRGSIFFTTRQGERISAATVKTGFLLAVNPNKLTAKEAVYQKLNQIAPIDRDVFTKRTEDSTSTYAEVATHLTKEQSAAIEALYIPGVLLYQDQWRQYPAATLAAHTIGFVGYNGNDLGGRYGLERYYDDTLARKDTTLSVNFFAEIFSDIGNGIAGGKNSSPEGDVVTSIEPTVSRTLEDELKNVEEKWHSKLSGGIIINPKTGAVYALGVNPSFDLNDRSGVSIEQFINPLVQSVYEMGSIIKPLTMAAGIDSGAITPTSTYYDPGCVTLDTHTFCNFDGKSRGTVPMQEILSQSLNTGAAYIAGQMGGKTFGDYFKKLQLGSETGIDLPSEAHGLISNLDSPRKLEYATAAFGQGISMTPIETVRALSTLANGGVLVTPHIGQKIIYTNGGEHDISFPDDGRVYSEKTTEDVTRMLVKVVDTALRGGAYKMDHYSVAAKTGTAQIAKPGGGGYYDDRFLHSFFGYFPAYDPQFFIFLFTVEPQHVNYASETLTQPFMNITKFLINYYNISPDR